MESIIFELGFEMSLTGITNPLYKFLWKQVMAELVEDKLRRDIRGEKWIVMGEFCSTYIESPCLNCYADSSNNCGDHTDINFSCATFRRISFNQFLKQSQVWCRESVFTLSRPGIQINSYVPDFLSDDDLNDFHMIIDACPDIDRLVLNDADDDADI